VCVCVCVHKREREREREGGGRENEWNPFVACSVATFLPVACFSVNSVPCGICRIVIIFFFFSCCSL